MDYKGFYLKKENYSGIEVVCIYANEEVVPSPATARTFPSEEEAMEFIDSELYPAKIVRERINDNNSITFHSDPSHAWLEVERGLLEILGLLGKISQFSYQDPHKNLVYLEEDCDAYLFINKLKSLGFDFKNEFNIKESSSDSDSFIRNLASYKAN